MPDYLGNKSNPFLAGLTGLGEGLFQGFILRKKMDEEQRQFNEKMNFEQRQQSLMDMFRQRDFEQRQQYQDAQIENLNADNARADELLKKPPREKNPVIKTSINPNTKLPGYYDVSNDEWLKDNSGNYLIAKEEGGGLTALSEYNIQKDKEDKQTKLDQAQLKYNSLMDSWDEKVGAYVIKKDNGSPLVFKDEKSLRKYAIGETLKMKPPGKVNFWSREKEQAKAEINIKLKYKDAFQALKNKGYSEQEAIDLIKKNEGLQ